jgi:hypothetical protein
MSLRNVFASVLCALAASSFSQSPASRGHFAIGYDATINKTVLTGGAAFFGQKLALFDDFWAWDGKVWKKLGTTGTPVMGSRMAYDAQHGRMLMMGGSSGERNPQTGELRALVRTQWITLGSAPELKGVDPGLAVDSKRSRIVVFIPGPDGKTGKTFEWDGRIWRPGHGQGPVDHEGISIAYDAKRGVIVGFGGHGVDKKPFDDVWEYDGIRWKQIVVQGPSARSYPGMAYDDKLGAVVIHGGMGPDFKWLGDTWAWNGSAWTKISDKGPAFESAMAYDISRDRLVVVGTDSHENNKAVMQTWEWDGSTWSKVAG